MSPVQKMSNTAGVAAPAEIPSGGDTADVQAIKAAKPRTASSANQPTPLSVTVGEPAAGHNGGYEARVEVAVARTGVEEAEVHLLPFDLGPFLEEGVLINVDAHGYGKLRRSLSFDAIGVKLPENSDVGFQAVRYGLLPERYLLPIHRTAKQAHDVLHKHSYRFSIVETVFETPAYLWVPWRAYPSFKEKFESIQEALHRAKQRVSQDYQAIRDEMTQVFLQLAHESAERLRATGQEVKDGFEEAVVEGALRSMPTPDILESVRLERRIGVVQLGSEALAEQRKAQEQQVEIERYVGERQVERERTRLRVEADKREAQREAEIKEELRQLKLQTARERMKQGMHPLEEALAQLHSTIFEAASAIKESFVERKGHFTGPSAKRSRELIGYFRMMALQDDAKLEELLGELEDLAQKTPASKLARRDPGEVTAVLDEIMLLTRKAARAATGSGRFSALEL